MRRRLPDVVLGIIPASGATTLRARKSTSANTSCATCRPIRRTPGGSCHAVDLTATANVRRDGRVSNRTSRRSRAACRRRGRGRVRRQSGLSCAGPAPPRTTGPMATQSLHPGSQWRVFRCRAITGRSLSDVRMLWRTCGLSRHPRTCLCAASPRRRGRRMSNAVELSAAR